MPNSEIEIDSNSRQINKINIFKQTLKKQLQSRWQNNPELLFPPKLFHFTKSTIKGKEITIVVIMMKYIQELRGGDLYSLKVSVCHVFAVYVVLMFRSVML